MTKTLFDTKVTLYPLPGETHSQIAVDIMNALVRKHPEYRDGTWSMSMKTYEDGTSQLRIMVLDPTPDYTRETYNFIVKLIVVLTFIALILYA